MKIECLFEANMQMTDFLDKAIDRILEENLSFTVSLKEVELSHIIFATPQFRARLTLKGNLYINYTLEHYENAIYSDCMPTGLEQHKIFLDGLYEEVEEITIKKELIIEKLKELYNKEITIF